MPFKIFTNGSILTDVDINDYLMEQAIISCTSGTRPGSPNDGMTIWETDTERYSSWNATAAAWITLGQMLSTGVTPSLAATTTNPTLGSGSAAQARYTLFAGKWCTYNGAIRFGTSGVNAGSGQYLISLPFAASSAITVGVPFSGSGVAKDNSAGPALRQLTTYIGGGSTTFAALANDTTIGSASPWVWAASDEISWDITYEIA